MLLRHFCFYFIFQTRIGSHETKRRKAKLSKAAAYSKAAKATLSITKLFLSQSFVFIHGQHHDGIAMCLEFNGLFLLGYASWSSPMIFLGFRSYQVAETKVISELIVVCFANENKQNSHALVIFGAPTHRLGSKF